MLSAAGLPADTTINYFSVESAALGVPQPVVTMSVAVGKSEAVVRLNSTEAKTGEPG